MTQGERFSIAIDINAPIIRVFEVMTDTDCWHEWTPSINSIKRVDGGGFAVGTRATLSLRYEGLVATLLARMTRGITNRYLELEASGLKARSENPYFHYTS